MRVSTRSLLLFAASMLAMSGCATQPAATAKQSASADTSCDLTDEQLARVRMSALEYLIAEWPVLDALCESIGTDVRRAPDGKCAISGGPMMKDSCPAPNHFGYVITFDEATLIPSSVYWLTTVDE